MPTKQDAADAANSGDALVTDAPPADQGQQFRNVQPFPIRVGVTVTPADGADPAVVDHAVTAPGQLLPGGVAAEELSRLLVLGFIRPI
jgi:hypothetical protein